MDRKRKTRTAQSQDPEGDGEEVEEGPNPLEPSASSKRARPMVAGAKCKLEITAVGDSGGGSRMIVPCEGACTVEKLREKVAKRLGRDLSQLGVLKLQTAASISSGEGGAELFGDDAVEDVWEHGDQIMVEVGSGRHSAAATSEAPSASHPPSATTSQQAQQELALKRDVASLGLVGVEHGSTGGGEMSDGVDVCGTENEVLYVTPQSAANGAPPKRLSVAGTSLCVIKNAIAAAEGVEIVAEPLREVSTEAAERCCCRDAISFCAQGCLPDGRAEGALCPICLQGFDASEATPIVASKACLHVSHLKCFLLQERGLADSYRPTKCLECLQAWEPLALCGTGAHGSITVFAFGQQIRFDGLASVAQLRAALCEREPRTTRLHQIRRPGMASPLSDETALSDGHSVLVVCDLGSKCTAYQSVDVIVGLDRPGDKSGISMMPLGQFDLGAKVAKIANQIQGKTGIPMGKLAFSDSELQSAKLVGDLIHFHRGFEPDTSLTLHISVCDSVKFALDLFTVEGHPIIDAASLLFSRRQVFANFRAVARAETVPDEGAQSTSTMLDVLAASVEWQPFGVASSEKAMSTLLSSMKVLSAAVSRDPRLAAAVADRFLTISGGYAPAVAALWPILCNTPSQLRAPHKAVLATVLALICKKMVPEEEAGALLLWARQLVGYLVCSAKPLVAAGAAVSTAMVFQDVSLECRLSHQRLRAPVMVDPEEQDFKVSAHVNLQPHSNERVFVVDEFTSLLVRAYPGCDAVNVLAREPVGTPFQPSRRLAAAVGWEDVLGGMDGESASFAKLYNARDLAAFNQQPPRLTLDETGAMVVFTARPKSESGGTLMVFAPLLGSEVCLDVAKAQTSPAASPVTSANGAAAYPTEVVMICLDTSLSMSSTSGFQPNRAVAPNRELEAINKCLREGWDHRANTGTGASVQALVEELKAIPAWDSLQRFVWDPGSGRRGRRAVSHSLSARRVRSARAVSVLQQILRLWHSIYPDRSADDFRTITSHREIFVALLTDAAPASSSAGDSAVGQEEEAAAAAKFLCPITQDVMNDPVVAPDGFSYERVAITDWLGANMLSPMTNLPLRGPSTEAALFPNQALKTLIREFRESKHAAAPPAFSITVKIFIEVLSLDPPSLDEEAGAGGAVASGTNSEPGEQTLAVAVHAGMSVGRLRAAVRAAGGLGWMPKLSLLGFKLSHQDLDRDADLLGDRGINASSRSVVYASPPALAMQVLDLTGAVTLAENKDVCLWEPVWSIQLRIWASLGGARCDAPADSELHTKVWKGDDGFYNVTNPEQTEVLSAHVDSNTTRTMRWHMSKTVFTDKDSNLSRLEVVRQLFEAFANRLSAYNFPTAVGLMSFASEVRVRCPLTTEVGVFSKTLAQPRADGETRLFDAISAASSGLKLWRDAEQKKMDSGVVPRREVKLRVVVLSDGTDTTSATQAHEAAAALQLHSIVLDAICVGSVDNQALHAVAKASGGYVFKPTSLQGALRLCELELLLCSHDRLPPSLTPAIPIRSPDDLVPFGRLPADVCSDDVAPARRQPALLSQQVVSLGAAISAPRPSAGEGRGMNRRMHRLMKEMRGLLADPQPQCDVYPNHIDLGFWKLVLEAPVDNDGQSPYSGGAWLLYMQFPEAFPAVAPNVRFVTPIRHCNINQHGRVCHSILDRNWTPDTSVRTVLDCIYSLLMQPDREDPLDSTLALEAYDDSGVYEAAVLAHTERHAMATSRAQWRTLLAQA